MERGMQALEPGNTLAVAWGLVKCRIEATGAVMLVADRAVMLAFQGEKLESAPDFMLLRVRSQIAKMKLQTDRALEALKEVETTRAAG